MHKKDIDIENTATNQQAWG